MSCLPPTLLKADPKRKRSLPPYNLDSDIYYNYSKMQSTAYGPKESLHEILATNMKK